MNTWLFFSKLMGIARRGVLKELDGCDFDNICSTCQRDDAVAVTNLVKGHVFL